MICDEREIVNKAKEINDFRETLTEYMDQVSSSLNTVTEKGVNDEKIKPLLLEMAADIITLKNSLNCAARNLAGELRSYAANVNREDDFDFPVEYDNIFMKAIDAMFSL
ncbi:MAG TPA: hypothetical protein IAA48_07185 [Candidatus Eubacterium faecipullorum]|uniref:Uncharacterized protein n=1 Tax=Candidatus Eubacterium faecipullorum TaxID=2838571 RepID=A0A9D1UFU8_9FIRM|nr:hypothetical protein [Candidatus Eubacterium faecipullorum]